MGQAAIPLDFAISRSFSFQTCRRYAVTDSRQRTVERPTSFSAERERGKLNGASAKKKIAPAFLPIGSYIFTFKRALNDYWRFKNEKKGFRERERGERDEARSPMKRCN